MRFKIILILLIFYASLLSEDSEEKLFSFEDETYHSTELSDLLQSYKKKPININTAAENELALIPWLSEKDIQKIISYRVSNKITNLKDLSKIGIDEITVNELSDYITFGASIKLKLKQASRVEFHQPKQYLPSTLKYFQKTILTLNNYKFGFISQKDEGEKDPLDFYSYFMDYSSEHYLKKLLIGKYRLALGQGILFAPKLGMSKSGAATSVPVKKFNLIKPYTSSYEIWELEGAVANIDLSAFNIIPFFSRTSISANLDTLSHITSFNESGLHLDDTKKNNVREMIYGLATKYSLTDHSFGLNLAKIYFDHQFSNPARENEYTAISADFMINKSSFPTFGEIAYSQQRIAGVIGSKFGENELRHLLLFRYYEKDFPTWHGNPFSSQSRFDNEVGLYYGMTIIPFEKTKINCYFDLWSFPQTRYFEKMPSVGSEQFIQIERKFDTNSLRISVQHKDKEKYISLDESKIRDFERTTFRADWWQNLDNFRFKTRCDIVTEFLANDDIHRSGILVYEEIKWKIEKLTLIGQISVYHSDILHYMYEHNVDGIMQNSILKGDGAYSYFVFKYNIFKDIELQFKVSDHWNTKDKMRLYLQVISSF